MMYRYMALGFMLVAVSGCDSLVGVLPFLDNTPTEVGSPELKAFASEQEVVDYFGTQVNGRNNDLGSLEDNATGGDARGGASPEPSAPTADDVAMDADGAYAEESLSNSSQQAGEAEHSGTTVQEEGVDEADVVKIDGTYAYIIGDQKLKIAQIDPLDSLGEISQTDLEGYGYEMYLYDNKVITLTTIGGEYVWIGEEEGSDGDDIVKDDGDEVIEDAEDGEDAEGEDGKEDNEDEPVEEPTDVRTEPSVDPFYNQYRYERPKTVVSVLDVTDPAAPTLLSKTAIDGTASSSRMIDGVLHLVVANYQHYYYDYWPMMGMADFDVEPSDLQIEELLPNYTRVDAQGTETSGAVLTWQELFRPTDPDGFGVVSVVSMDIDSDAVFTAKGIVAEPGLIYSSLDALYLTDTNWDFWGTERQTTDIYKFVYEGTGTRPAAAGTIQGRILNQYSMGEYDGYLRVAVTVGTNWGWFGEQTQSTNAVYVLQDKEGVLETVGSITGIAPGEDIKSARFIGPRGYVVTFEQIDPLFTLDLSSPTAPKLVGELKVPGYSTFIVPMDDDHLLTVGQYIPDEDDWWGAWGVQLSIFDISDFANPTLKHSEIIGEEGGAWSEALYNPKAFTYYNDMVALPISIYDYYRGGVFMEDDMVVDVAPDGDAAVSVAEAPEVNTVDSEGAEEADGEPIAVEEQDVEYQEGFEGVYFFSVTADAGFAKLGEISTRFEDAYYYWSSFTRGAFVGDNVFAITDRGIRGGDVNALDGELAEMTFTYNVEDDPWYGFVDEPTPVDIDEDGAVTEGSEGEVGTVAEDGTR